MSLNPCVCANNKMDFITGLIADFFVWITDECLPVDEYPSSTTPGLQQSLAESPVIEGEWRPLLTSTPITRRAGPLDGRFLSPSQWQLEETRFLRQHPNWLRTPLAPTRMAPQGRSPLQGGLAKPTRPSPLYGAHQQAPHCSNSFTRNNCPRPLPHHHRPGTAAAQLQSSGRLLPDRAAIPSGAPVYGAVDTPMTRYLQQLKANPPTAPRAAPSAEMVARNNRRLRL